MSITAWVASLKLVHGAFNLGVALLFVRQAWLGTRIRRSRMGGSPSFDAIRSHRRMGPVLVVLGIVGFLAGVALVYVDEGRIIKYPLHFFAGLVVSVLIVCTFAASRSISARSAEGRVRHFVLGIALLGCYVVQITLGLDVLL